MQALTRHKGSLVCLAISRRRLLSGSVDSSIKVGSSGKWGGRVHVHQTVCVVLCLCRVDCLVLSPADLAVMRTQATRMEAGVGCYTNWICESFYFSQ